MDAVERDNPSLKGVLPKNYAREALDKRRLGELIDLFTNTTFKSDNAKDLLGRVYEYFMGMFADSEGKHGGEFYTPRSIVMLLVDMLEPYSGRVYDPACGSGGMFVQSEKFVEEHSGRLGDIAIYGQELNETTWRLAKMNMAIRGIDADIRRGDSFHEDRFPDLKADYIIAKRIITIGTLTASLVHPREVFAEAITDRAASIIVVHNHPSGNLEPSQADRDVTERLKEAGLILGVQLEDHLIVTSKSYLSIV